MSSDKKPDATWKGAPPEVVEIDPKEWAKRENERRWQNRQVFEARRNAERQARLIADALLQKPKQTRTSTTREDALSVAIRAARVALQARLRREPKAAEVIQYLESEASPEGPVVDYQDDALIWMDANGKLHNTRHKTVAHRLTSA